VSEAEFFGGVYRQRRVLVTGHTGFKGSWLSRWLLDLGAEVTGYALQPDTSPSLFEQLGLDHVMDSHIGDVRDFDGLKSLVAKSSPEIIFHLAAQPLVRRSYTETRYTFETNVMGAVNLFEAVRELRDCRVVVNVTTDKVYENPETGVPFDEKHALGGHDPYSASKAAAEIVTASYRDSFFSGDGGPAVATARAGNVIGGGDWAEDRLIPDCVRALFAAQSIVVRNPKSVRPWQHVLEPLAAYLHLASALVSEPALAGPYNFGPEVDATRTVEDVVERFIDQWGTGSWHQPPLCNQPHEAATLTLDIRKAEEKLGWSPLWDFEETVARTASWYRAQGSGADVTALVRGDIEAYVVAAISARAPWISGRAT